MADGASLPPKPVDCALSHPLLGWNTYLQKAGVEVKRERRCGLKA